MKVDTNPTVYNDEHGNVKYVMYRVWRNERRFPWLEETSVIEASFSINKVDGGWYLFAGNKSAQYETFEQADRAAREASDKFVKEYNNG